MGELKDTPIPREFNFGQLPTHVDPIERTATAHRTTHHPAGRVTDHHFDSYITLSREGLACMPEDFVAIVGDSSLRAIDAADERIHQNPPRICFTV
ncbi:hypothetical protein N7466_006429 [Penicillium verhagenii]|uniref:uncharacterized protein n=1 Tax=Penicillium verhagenii TaxID=1562060 RepID=UPI00254560F8|nr:uncharacterized protein N7466_006429 [Penicillium verhagenii]KAJ5930936.1 hypothetical protein N7466_006429 [Penicillium verhagenii]